MNYLIRIVLKPVFRLVLLLLAQAAVSGCTPETAQAPPAAVMRDVEVAMRDGVLLRADVYLPPGTGPFPVLVYRTPYGKHYAARTYTTHENAVARGYAVVLQDVRGRYASDGIFEPYRNEGPDGYDTIEWAAAQSWSDGSVGTFGLSYPGAVQWLAAIESPPHLKAMVPAMTFSSPRKFFYSNGAFDLAWLPWIFLDIAPDARKRLGLPGITTEEAASREWQQVADEYAGFLPLAELPYLREEAPFYFDWLTHPPEDPWWDWAEITTRYTDVDAAVLNLSGWYDDPYGPEGATTNHQGLVNARPGDPRSRLIMGPWKHGVLATGQTTLGELDFGPDAAIDYDGEILDFFNRYLRGQDSGPAEPPVRYFVMGSNQWRHAQSWPPADAVSQSWCLAEGGLGACDETAGASSTSFTADPNDPVTDRFNAPGPHDYRYLAARPDVLTFDSAVLDSDLTIAGNVVARINVSCDCEDFDLWLELQDVYPDGRAVNLASPGSQMMRLSYRDPDAGRLLLVPDDIYELTLDQLMLAATFKAGHRIRLQVAASFAPHLSGNLQTGASEAYSDESRAAEITLYHSVSYPTVLELPVIE